MKILIDADSCPAPCKEVLFNLNQRNNMPLIFVANRLLKLPKKDSIQMLLSGNHKNAADNIIFKLASSSDIVISSDMGLAKKIIHKDGHVITPYGYLFKRDNFLNHYLSSAAKMIDTYNYYDFSHNNKPSYNNKHKTEFANTLDKTLCKLLKNTG